jgi:predicted DNA binding CopG/RHH family protein
MDKNEAIDIPISTDKLNNNLDKYFASTSQPERPNSRTLRVAPQYIQSVKSALSRTGFVRQRDLAEQLYLSLATVNNFLNGKFVEHLNFLELSKTLGLDWQEIADFGTQEREDSNSTEQQNRHTNRQSSRSLRVSSQRISAVKSAVLRNGFPNQEALAGEVGVSLSTVKNFLNGKPVSRENFRQICDRLTLDWTAWVDFGIQELDSSAH